MLHESFILYAANRITANRLASLRTAPVSAGFALLILRGLCHQI